jgi:hypothetical protein
MFILLCTPFKYALSHHTYMISHGGGESHKARWTTSRHFTLPKLIAGVHLAVSSHTRYHRNYDISQ